MQNRKDNPISHAAIYLVARGLPGILGFAAIPLFTRLLDPADYGRFALVIASVNLLNALLFQWLRLSLVRYLHASGSDVARLKSTLMTTSLLIIAATGAIGALVCLFPIGMTWRSTVAACWLVLALQAVFELCSEYARAGIRPWRYMSLQLARSAAMVVLGVAFVLLGMGWWGPTAGMAVGMTLAVAAVYRRDWADARFLVDRAYLTKICQYGLPLSLTVALAIVVGSSDRFLIKWLLGVDATGLYSVASDFTSQTLTLLMMVIYLAMFPVAVRAFEEHGREAAQHQMRSNASLLLAVGLPCVVGLTVLAPGIAHCFLGESYRASAAKIIPLIAFGSFLAGLKAYHFDSAFQFAHRTIEQVWIVLVVAVLNIALNLIAIPIWGINGAAGASALAYGVSILIAAAVGRRHFALPFPFSAVVATSLSAAAMGLILYPFRQHVSLVSVAMQIAVGAFVYALVLTLQNFLGLREALIAKLRRLWSNAPVAESANAGFRASADVEMMCAVAESTAVAMVEAR